MKVKLNSARIVQSQDGKGGGGVTRSEAVGDIVDMPPDEAKRYIDRGLASPVTEAAVGSVGKK